jgi:dihydrofolate reductase
VSFDVVVAADLDWGIGKENGLPWPKLRADLRHFKKTTSTASPGKRNAIVMGRKTWQSKEVGCAPLPNRLNVVVSKDKLEVPPGVVVAHSLDEALGVHEVESIFIVGGAGLIVHAIEHPALRYVYLTRVESRFDCDTKMPNLDERGFVKDDWDGALKAEEHEVKFRIERLKRPA